MTAIVEQAHKLSLQVSIEGAAKFLQEILSRKLTAYIAGVKDAKTVTRWANGEVTEIRVAHEQRLRTAYEIVQLLLQFDAPQTVRAWFIGMNPQLDDASPAETIRGGQFKEAMGAARAFIASG